MKKDKIMVNEEMLGLKIKSFIQVTINYAEKDAIKNFKSKLESIDEVVESYHVTGSSDYLLKVIVPDIKSYENLIVEKFSKMPEIKSLQSLMILSNTKQSRAIPIEY